jgi:hypothetical protein
MMRRLPSPDYLTLLLFYLEFGEHCVFVMEIIWRRFSAAKIVLDSGKKLLILRLRSQRQATYSGFTFSSTLYIPHNSH